MTRTHQQRPGRHNGADRLFPSISPAEHELLEGRVLLSSAVLAGSLQSAADETLAAYAGVQGAASSPIADLLAQAAGSIDAGWPFAQWNYRKSLTIDHTKVVGDQSDFAVLVSITDADLAAKARADGADILFTAGDGSTKLSHEIESYDSAAGKLIAWVRVPLISASADTTLKMYYGNASAGDQQDAHGVWDGGYLAVQHLEESSGAATDSAAAGLDGAVSGGVTRPAAGEVGGGYAFDGTTGRVVMPQVYTNQAAFTIEGWVNTASRQGYVVAQRDTLSRGVLLQYYPSGSQFQLYVNGVKISASATAGAWHYLSATFDGGTARLYVDGVLASSAAASLTWPNTQMILGDSSAGTRKFQGSMDELRFSSVARGQAYFQTALNNQSSPGGFVSVGAEEGGDVVSISNESPSNGALNQPADLGSLSFDLQDSAGHLVSYTVTTTPDIGSASASGVAGGTFQVPISGLSNGTQYSWTVQAGDGNVSVSRTFTFTVGTGWGLPEWRYRTPITVDHTKVAADLAHFPVLVDITDADLAAHAQADGHDIVFTTGDGVTQLDFGIESYDAATGHLVAWVSADVSATQDVTLFYYYGNENTELETNNDPNAVWDGDFLSVLHLNEATGTFQDATINNADAVPLNGLAQGAGGKIDGAPNFDGVDDRIEMSPVFDGSGPFTVEGWVYTNNKQGYLFYQRDTSGNGTYIQYYPNTAQFQFFINSAKLTAGAALNGWHYFAATFDGATARLYVDGAMKASAAAGITWPSQNTTIGDRPSGGRTVLGAMDEVRFSSVARSAEYIQTSFASQNAPESFLQRGERQKPSSALSISEVYPAGGAQEIELNPTLGVTITNSEGNPFDYAIQILSAGVWQTIAAGSGVSGPVNVTAPTSTVTAYDTEYSWRVSASNATDGSVQQAFSFRTRLVGNYEPVITSVLPVDGSTGVELRPVLSANVKDVDGDLMDITFSILDNATGLWQTIQTYTNVPSGTYTAESDGWASQAVSTYQWKVTAVDHPAVGQVGPQAAPTAVTEQVYTFSTGGLMSFKWSQSLSIVNTIEGQLHPVAGDVDGDGHTEIVLTSGDSLYCLNGATGTVKWRIAGQGRELAPELADINNDGRLEILYTLTGTRVRAVRGDGTILWTTGHLQGADQSLFPLLTADTDGDGLPTIYFITEDQAPVPWDGNPADYIGAVNKLDNNGKLLATTWLYHPCWGGASLGYFGSRWILFVSDRRYGYNNAPSHGLAAYDAETLETLWTRPDIHHSSPIPIIADTDNDGQMELVAQKIVGNGPMILDPLTGETIKDYSNRGLPTHGTATVYDLDEDGNQEIIMASGYPTTIAKDFVVFDLTTGKTEFHPTFTYHATWPPRVADINGDGHMEILAAMGDQSNRTGTFPLLVYDHHYNLIDRVDATGAGQLCPAKVYDVDDDGLQEIVLVGRGGKVLVYDTQAPVPTPAPRSGIQMYSEYRANAAVYVAPPGPALAKIWQENIADGASNIGLGPTLSVRVHDFQYDRMDITFEVGAYVGGNWQYQTVVNYWSKTNGTYSADTAGFVTQSGTQYRWRVTAVDTYGHVSQRTLTFTTAGGTSGWGQPDWQYRKRVVMNHNLVSGTQNNFAVLIDTTSASLASHAQADGDDFIFTAADGVTRLSHEIESYNPSTGRLVAWVEVPSLSATTDTVLYLYYGNSGVGSQENAAGTWDSDYLAVQHMEETSGAMTDSTGNALNGTVLNGVGQGVSARIDGGYSFDGVNDLATMPRVYTTQTAFTIEGWFNPAVKQGYIVSQRNSSSQGMMLQYYAPSSQFQFFVNGAKVSASAAANSWHYVVAAFDSGTLRLYVDGKAPVTATGSITWPNLQMYIGDSSSGGRDYQGLMDELRFSDIARSQGYAATSYNNQNNPSAFVTVDTEERKPAGGGLQAPDGSNVLVNPAMAGAAGGAGSTGVDLTAPDGAASQTAAASPSAVVAVPPVGVTTIGADASGSAGVTTIPKSQWSGDYYDALAAAAVPDDLLRLQDGLNVILGHLKEMQ